MSAPQTQFLQQHILSWFEHNGRDLPWRHTHDPYQILVSEVMLQQTQVDRVLPKYHQFLHAYPTVFDLAKAPTAEVIKAWFPLGYNRRPVRLKAIAESVVERYNGIFPDNFEALLELPGVGPYTAGAIMCFAYQHDVGFIDTNIRRIVHRWLVGVDYPKQQASDKLLQVLAEQIVPQGRGYDWNQALMDFGSAICTSNQPKCQDCPVQSHCAAYPAITLVTKAKQPAKQKFTESNRYFRGKTLRILAQAPHHKLTADQLQLQLKDGEAVDQDWFSMLMAQLDADQLIVHDADNDTISLP